VTRTYRVQDIAAELDLSPGTVRRMVRDGVLARVPGTR
jgi:hypothetical protein